MKKGDKLTGNKGIYTLKNNFEVTGGMSKVTFAVLDGKDYFLKEFLSPKYPIDLNKSGSPAIIERKKKRCAQFESHHKTLNEKIASKVGLGGNLVCAFDFFRNGTTYYKVTEKIDVSSFTVHEIAKMTEEQKLLIMKTVTSSLKILSDLGIVHGDLKPDNVLIKKTALGAYTTKLIDFDNSYFSENPPENNEETVGDQVYYSPELGKYIKGLLDTKPKNLTIKSDVFALGILFSQYITGNRPEIGSKYKYVYEAVLNGVNPITKTSSVPNYIIGLILKMLSLNPVDRPDIAKVHNVLKGIGKDEFAITIKEYEESKEKFIIIKEEPGIFIGSGLKGKLVEEKTMPEKEADRPVSILKGKLIDKIK